MKKIFASFIALGIFITGFAQSQKIEEAKRVINGTPQDRKVYGETGTSYPETYPTGKKRVATGDKKYKKNKKYKKDNGKHLGWQKGVGNPHRTKGKGK